MGLVCCFHCTCALRVSRGLSILGKAIRATPRESSDLGLEGDPCVPLKLWTTHIPCREREREEKDWGQTKAVCAWPLQSGRPFSLEVIIAVTLQHCFLLKTVQTPRKHLIRYQRVIHFVEPMYLPVNTEHHVISSIL